MRREDREDSNDESDQDSYSDNIGLASLAPEAVRKKGEIDIQGKRDDKAVTSKEKNEVILNTSNEEVASMPRQLQIARESKPRLVIDHMVLQNFKSYADTQVIGKFHHNFTSIVGPNGSGKSNLIESMLFIFGFSASWMRLNKLNQLIHNSSTLTEVSRAGVEVHFKKVIDNSQGIPQEVSGSGFYLRRTVNSNSISKYYLNGHESSQAEVKERLKGEGIDLNNNRFLILQGEVEQISQMKQKSGDRDHPGLLEYLQDIIGSAKFIDQIEENVVAYNHAEEEKHEKGQLMRMVEMELKGMDKEKEEAIRFVKKEKKVFQLHNVLNQVIISNCKHELTQLNQRLDEQEKIKERIMAEEREKLKKQGERIKDIKKNKADIEEMQRGLEKANDSLSKLSVADKNITHEVKFKSQDLVKFERNINDLDKELHHIINQSQELSAKMPASADKLKQMHDQLQTMKQELSKHDKPKLKQQIKDCETEIRRHQIEINTYRNKMESSQEMHRKLHSNTNQQLNKTKEYEEKLRQSKAVQVKIEMAQGMAQRFHREKKQKIAVLLQTREGLRNELQQIQGYLKESLSQRQETGQLGNMFKQIMKLKIPGVLGRLGDLGSTSKQYDEIITTCCNRLDNIVVTNYEAANGVVEFLKKTKIGRATCIILDKIADYRNYMSKRFDTPDNAVRLFDVIRPINQEARVAFYFALNDTLYCQNSNLGLKYSMGDSNRRRRVISRKRNGYIIYEMSGLMVGCQAKRGGFEAKAGVKAAKGVKEEGGRQMQQKKKEIEDKLQKINRILPIEERELKVSHQDIEQMRREIISVADSIRECQEELKDLKEAMYRQASQKQAPSNLEEEIVSLKEEISQRETLRTKVQSKLKGLEMEQKKNENEEVAALREKYKNTKAEYMKLQKQVDREKATMKTTVSRVEENKKSKAQNQKNIDFLKKNIAELKAQQEQIENKAAEMMGRVVAMNDRLAELRKAEQELKVIFEDDEKDVRESKAKVEKAKKDVQNCRQQCQKQKMDLNHAISELQKCRQQYQSMTSSYDFLEELEEIDKMSLNADPRVSGELSTSMLETSLLDESMEVVNVGTKQFPMRKLLKIDPNQDISQDKLDPFLLFRDKLSSLIVTESTNLKKMQGNNLQIINEFRKKFISYKERLANFEAVKSKQAELKKLIDRLKEERLTLFREAFGVINNKLKSVYQHLTRGGDAELELIDSLDPFSDGVNFSVRPPKKSWKEVNKLSGGEKTLSSLSLIFALHYYKPTPLYFMDEIDAALDFKNVSIVADYIKKRTKDAQFIIISLRNNMFDLADKLIGVYKTHDKTKVINLQTATILANKETTLQKENIEANCILALPIRN